MRRGLAVASAELCCRALLPSVSAECTMRMTGASDASIFVPDAQRARWGDTVERWMQTRAVRREARRRRMGLARRVMLARVGARSRLGSVAACGRRMAARLARRAVASSRAPVGSEWEVAEVAERRWDGSKREGRAHPSCSAHLRRDH